jgi:hypothetical protein
MAVASRYRQLLGTMSVKRFMDSNLFFFRSHATGAARKAANHDAPWPAYGMLAL